MAVRRRRVPVVLDTNVLAAAFLSRDPQSSNLRLYRVWAERRLQLVLSDPIAAEYLGVLGRLGASAAHLRAFSRRLATRASVTRVRPAKDLKLSRDLTDNMFLSAAAAGKARFLVTNYHDLLQIPAPALRAFRFRIVTPAEFVRLLKGLRR